RVEERQEHLAPVLDGSDGPVDLQHVGAVIDLQPLVTVAAFDQVARHSLAAPFLMVDAEGEAPFGPGLGAALARRCHPSASAWVWARRGAARAGIPPSSVRRRAPCCWASPCRACRLPSAGSTRPRRAKTATPAAAPPPWPAGTAAPPGPVRTAAPPGRRRTGPGASCRPGTSVASRSPRRSRG